MKLKSFDTIDNLTRAQQLMIRACLAIVKEEREHAVHDWEDEVLIDDLDFSSSRLIPYFFYGNQQHGIISRHDKRLKVIYKHWWLRTQHISHQLKKVEGALFEAGIDAVIIKGASIKMHYEREELRPMADFDLLVKPSDLQNALQIVKNLDYLPHEPSEFVLQKSTNLFLDFNHAISCAHKKNDTHIDLHWRVGSRCSMRFSDDLWLHLENYSGLTHARRPQLAYEVFMLIIHAVNYGNRDNLNWIIDIAVINIKADRSFWKEARALAVAEKKEDLFDYGCSVLIKFGVYAPDPGSVKKPRALISIDPDYGQQMSYMKLTYTRIWNLITSVNRLLPHAKVSDKLYQSIRYTRFVLIRRNARSIKS
ncbi:nucleotidyltransferase family protein [Mucilaginibacter sp. L196]|uniref:nucleotidyltransferase family protein n=1 Tax=Mucilaginibacter sp. L196 TaxID=1641870 RepID=UPI00131CFFAF|nr:nucleotidyltransferase family protein [Mucilaginibacter sp. L196]